MVKKIDNLDIRIGHNLRKLRKFNKLTQKEVGYILNVSAQQITKYETGKNRISASNLYKLADYYNKEINLFFIISLEEISEDWYKND